jgi:uncharacterized coiled-coil DUF342 family protein
MRTATRVLMMIVAVAFGCAAPDAGAQTTTPPVSARAPGEVPAQLQDSQDRARTADVAVAVPRFSLQRIDGGYMRLDAEHGSVAFCAPRNPSWNCATVKGEGAAANEVVCTPRGDPDWNCQELSVDRAALEKEIVQLREDVATLKQGLDRRQEDVISLQRDFDQRQGVVASLKQEIDRYREQATSLKQEFDRRHEEVASLKQESDRRQEEIASLKQDFDRRQGEIMSLRQEVERHREQATLLQQEVDRRREEVTSLREEASRRQGEMALLGAEIAALRAPAAPPADETGDDFRIALPSSSDIARAGAYLQDTARDAWHRLVDMIGDFQRDVMRKS